MPQRNAGSVHIDFSIHIGIFKPHQFSVCQHLDGKGFLDLRPVDIAVGKGLNGNLSVHDRRCDDIFQTVFPLVSGFGLMVDQNPGQ